MNKKGFTLIELLVSIAIIAILTAIVTANFATSKSKARDAERISDLAHLNLALELYFDRCNQYPRELNGMPKLADASGCPSGSGITLANFISKIPTAPTPGSSYSYGVNNATTPTDFVLKAVLENNNSALVDSPKTNFTSLLPSPGIDCSTTYAYCIQPR